MSDTNANIATVSGGSSGFGAQICRHMLDLGYDVISDARRKPDWSRKNLYTVEADLLEAPATVEEVAGRLAAARVAHNAGVSVNRSSERASCRSIGRYAILFMIRYFKLVILCCLPHAFRQDP
jgi:NADP-dependent 3-hydroxy acid dehydrogenase YdfG